MLGVSVDAAAANTTFREQQNLPFPLLCDTDRKLAIAYGAAAAADARFARRIAVLIGDDGRIAEYWDKVDVRTFAATALQAVHP